MRLAVAEGKAEFYIFGNRDAELGIEAVVVEGPVVSQAIGFLFAGKEIISHRACLAKKLAPVILRVSFAVRGAQNTRWPHCGHRVLSYDAYHAPERGAP